MKHARLALVFLRAPPEQQRRDGHVERLEGTRLRLIQHINKLKMLGEYSTGEERFNMKTIVKNLIYLQMTAVLLTAALAGPAAAEKQVPFKGSVQAVESYDIQFPTMFVDTTGTGEATHLGRFTVTWEFTVNLLNGAGIGSAHFIAANGDSVFTESLGQGDPTETPGINRVVETHTITGGTGRFAGATGSFTLERLVSLATGITAGSFNGSIVIHKTK